MYFAQGAPGGEGGAQRLVGYRVVHAVSSAVCGGGGGFHKGRSVLCSTPGSSARSSVWPPVVGLGHNTRYSRFYPRYSGAPPATPSTPPATPGTTPATPGSPAATPGTPPATLWAPPATPATTPAPPAPTPATAAVIRFERLCVGAVAEASGVGTNVDLGGVHEVLQPRPTPPPPKHCVSMKALIRLHDPQLLVLIRHLCPVLEIPAGRCWDAMPPPKPAYSSSLHGAPQGAWGQQLGGGALRHNPPPPPLLEILPLTLHQGTSMNGQHPSREQPSSQTDDFRRLQRQGFSGARFSSSSSAPPLQPGCTQKQAGEENKRQCRAVGQALRCQPSPA